MNQAIKDFIGCQHIAVVGVSRTGKGFGNAAMKELQVRGYKVFPVHPSLEYINGERCVTHLSALKDEVEGVFICVPPKEAVKIIEEAAAIGIRNVWLQQGAESPEALEVARAHDLNLVSGKCILMYVQPVRSFHGWHRAFVQLTGRL